MFLWRITFRRVVDGIGHPIDGGEEMMNQYA
jgi:hypothetical protein